MIFIALFFQSNLELIRQLNFNICPWTWRHTMIYMTALVLGRYKTVHAKYMMKKNGETSQGSWKCNLVQFLRRYILPKKCSYWRKKKLFSLASPRFHTVCKKLDYSINNPKKCRWEENKFSHFETHQSAVKSLSVIFNHIKLQWNKLNFYKYLGVEKRNAYFLMIWQNNFIPFYSTKSVQKWFKWINL